MRGKYDNSGVIKVGKNKFYWIVYDWSLEVRWLEKNDWKLAKNAEWMTDDGFATTLEEAMDRIRDYGVVRGYKGAGDKRIRDIYSELYARKPGPSKAKGARIEGSLWEYYYYSNNYGPDEVRWTECRIIKSTAKRYYLHGGRDSYGEGVRLISLDRLVLDRDGHINVYRHGWTTFYTPAGKAAYEAEETQRQTIKPDDYPSLGLTSAASEEEIVAAFRVQALKAHPDTGGDAAAFRQLIAERDAALARVRMF